MTHNPSQIPQNTIIINPTATNLHYNDLITKENLPAHLKKTNYVLNEDYSVDYFENQKVPVCP